MSACQVPLFASLSPSQKSQLCTALRPLHVKAGTAIVRAGDAGNTFYVVEAGTCTVHSTQGKVRPPQRLHTRAGFGPGLKLRLDC